MIETIIKDYLNKAVIYHVVERATQQKEDGLKKKIQEFEERIKEKQRAIAKIHSDIIDMHANFLQSPNKPDLYKDVSTPIAEELAKRTKRIPKLFGVNGDYIGLINPHNPEDILDISLDYRHLQVFGAIDYYGGGRLPEDWDEVIKLLRPVKRSPKFYSLHELGEEMAKLHNWTIFKERPESESITFRMPWQDANKWIDKEHARMSAVDFDEQCQVLYSLGETHMFSELEKIYQDKGGI